MINFFINNSINSNLQKEVKPAIEQLPLELFETILSSLNNSTLISTTLVNSSWNKRNISFLQKREFYNISNFSSLLANKITSYVSNFNQPLIENLKNIGSKRNHDVCPSIFSIQEKYSNFKTEIKNLLTKISNQNIEKIFDSFTSEEKSQLFYEFVFMSDKYRTLCKNFNESLYVHPNKNSEKLLRNGVVPNLDSLHISLNNLEELVPLILNTGAIIPSSKNLGTAIFYKDSDRLVEILLNLGAIPTQKHLNFAVLNNSFGIVKLLLENGLYPAENSLDIALQYKHFAIALLLLKAKAIPSDPILKRAEQLKKEIPNKGIFSNDNKAFTEFDEFYQLLLKSAKIPNTTPFTTSAWEYLFGNEPKKDSIHYIRAD